MMWPHVAYTQACTYVSDLDKNQFLIMIDWSVFKNRFFDLITDFRSYMIGLFIFLWSIFRLTCFMFLLSPTIFFTYYFPAFCVTREYSMTSHSYDEKLLDLRDTRVHLHDAPREAEGGCHRICLNIFFASNFHFYTIFQIHTFSLIIITCFSN